MERCCRRPSTFYPILFNVPWVSPAITIPVGYGGLSHVHNRSSASEPNRTD